MSGIQETERSVGKIDKNYSSIDLNSRTSSNCIEITPGDSEDDDPMALDFDDNEEE
jgi:hypothetical protein